MNSNTPAVEYTVEELLEQNKLLSEELQQCQKDKDFVWNLWKSLQDEKPDIAEVIKDVVQREQKKSDEKDLKVLTILHQKDEQIKILQDISADLQVQIKGSNERLSELLIAQAEWVDLKSQLEHDFNEVSQNLANMNQLVTDKDEAIELLKQSLDSTEKQQRALEDELEKSMNTIRELNNKINNDEIKVSNFMHEREEFDSQILSLTEKIKFESKEKHQIFIAKCDAEKKCWHLKDELQKMKVQNKELKKRNNNKEEKLKQKEKQCQSLEESIQSLNEQIANFRDENVMINDVVVSSDDSKKSSNDKLSYQRKINVQSHVIDKLHDLVNSMAEEMKTIRSAHQQRLQRYKALKENYNLIQQQLKTYEKSNIFSPSEEEPEISRASTKSLQRENSRSVWNELAFYKKEFENLDAQQPSLLEELDQLQVKSSKDTTKISQLKLRVAEFEKLLLEKENISNAETELLKEEMHEKLSEKEIAFVSLSNQLQIIQTKLSEKGKEIEEKDNKIVTLTEQNSAAVSKLKEFEEKTSSLTKQLSDCKYSKNQETQTDIEAADSKQLFDKMAEVIDHFTASQQESFIETSLKTSKSNSSTQTTPHKLKHNETEHRNLLEEQVSKECKQCFYRQQMLDKVVEQNSSLVADKNKLLVLQSELQKRNKLMKDKIRTLENEISDIDSFKASSTKTVADLHEELDGIQEELATVMHSLQVSKSALNDRNKELSSCREELNAVSLKYEEEVRDMKNLTKDYKALDKRFKDFKEEYETVTSRLKVANKENIKLSDDLQQLSEKHVKLEHLLNHKKIYCDELKRTNNQLKQNVEEKEKLHKSVASKLKNVLDRETSNKEYIETLKSKLENNTNKIMELEKSRTKLQRDVTNKSRMLENSQQLCLQAESAINEMEKATYEQLKAKEKSHGEKELVFKEKLLYTHTQNAELNKSIKEFFEALLSMIRENRNNLLKHMKEKQQQSLYQLNDAPDIACSILDMSTSDLKSFMEDGMSNIQLPFPEYEENDVRSKLEIILMQKGGFSEVLSKFLLDLIHYNWTFLSKDLLLNNTEPM